MVSSASYEYNGAKQNE